MKIKKYMVLLLITAQSLWGDVGVLELQKDRVYRESLSLETQHLKQYFNSSELDYLNTSLLLQGDWGKLSLFNPTVFSSFVSSAPSSINDGALWQGKGFNGQIETGLVFNSKYVDIRFVPKVWVAQNLDFVTVPSAYRNEDSPRGEFGSIHSGMDTYQRLGDTSYYKFDWGKSAILLKYGLFNLEFSTDNFIMGPGRVSPLIMSDHAGGFPHLRLGLNKWNTALGVFEYNAFFGLLKESDFFDTDPENNSVFFSAYNFAWSPHFLPGFTFGLNRSLIAKYHTLKPTEAFKIYDPFIFGGIIGEPYGYDETDQRVSFVADWVFPEADFRIYAELGKNDYSTDYELFLRTPEHAGGITLGFSKGLGDYLIEFEHTDLIESREYTIGVLRGGGTFYKHHLITHGYNNDGQILGAGIGTGSEAQTLSVSRFRDNLNIKGYLQRVAINKDYIYGGHYRNSGVERGEFEVTYPVNLLQFYMKTGVKAAYNFNNFTVFGEFSYDIRPQHNFMYKALNHNFYGALGVQYKL